MMMFYIHDHGSLNSSRSDGITLLKGVVLELFASELYVLTMLSGMRSSGAGNRSLGRTTSKGNYAAIANG